MHLFHIPAQPPTNGHHKDTTSITTWLMLEDTVTPFITYIFNATSNPSLQRKNEHVCQSPFCEAALTAAASSTSAGSNGISVCSPHLRIRLFSGEGFTFMGDSAVSIDCVWCVTFIQVPEWRGQILKILSLSCTWKSACAPDGSTAPLLSNICMYIYIHRVICSVAPWDRSMTPACWCCPVYFVSVSLILERVSRFIKRVTTDLYSVCKSHGATCCSWTVQLWSTSRSWQPKAQLHRPFRNRGSNRTVCCAAARVFISTKLHDFALKWTKSHHIT